MRLIGNLIWLVFSGFWLAITYFIAGVIMCVLIITIPFGLQAFKLANFSLWPFGRTVVEKPTAGAASLIGNVIWILVCGVPLVIMHLVTAVVLAVTIIGIPLAIGNLKMIPISLVPFGKEIVPITAGTSAPVYYKQPGSSSNNG